VISAIICTYNRPKLVCQLVDQLVGLNFERLEVIVVDSSDQGNEKLIRSNLVNYIRSSRKSQPYQRFLGAENANNEILCFFDDDVKIVDDNLLKDIQEAFEDDEIVGVSAGIKYESGVAMNRKGLSKELKGSGKISWLGRTTGLPTNNREVQYFPGPIMAFRKQVALKLFDEYLFSIFERRIAMGEDKAISMRASKYGKLYFLGKKFYLHHPPEPSTYYSDNESFIAKVVFSRLWLSKIYAEVHNKLIMQAYLLNVLYVLKTLVNYSSNKKKLKGVFKGILWQIKY